MMTTMLRRLLATGFLLAVASFWGACTTTDHVAGLSRPLSLNALTVRSITATDLGILPGHTGGSALDVNRSGQAVGFSFISFKDLEFPQPVLWDASGPVALADNAGQALAVNDAGVVVGYVGSNAMLWGNGVPLEVLSDRFTVAMDVAMDERVVGTIGSPAGPGLSTAALWEKGRFSKLELPLGSDYVYEVHINDAGQIVAGVWNAKDKSVRSFLVDANGAADLGSLGGRATWAHAINATGQIVGTSLTAAGEAHAFLWEVGQTMRDLGGLGGSWSHAWGINGHGDVVGESALPGDLEWHAVVWVNGKLSDLGALPSYVNGAAHAINDVGQAVGSSYAAAKCEPVLVVDEPRPLPGPGCYGTPRPTLWTIQLANTPSGSDITVMPVDATTGQPSAVELTFDNVTGGGETTVSSQTVGQGGGPPAPRQFRLGSPPTYYNIETSATFAGNVTVCIHYADVSYGTERQLKLQHFANGRWFDATDPGYPDLVNHVICGTVASLSPFLVAQQNFDPIVTGISLPNDPIALGSSASVTAAFADANPSDTHTASVAWQEGVTSSGAVAEKDGAGTVVSSHTYTAAGVYTIVVAVNDGLAAASRSSALDVPAYVVVYDPSAGFATGGGWITSPAGAYGPDPALAGKASFGFVAKYVKGATNPSGNTEFQFQEGNLAFQSTSYQWLVVGGAKAQFKGEGTINGAGVYGFLLTAIDGQLNGGGGADRFRLKIWDKSTDAVIYDNQRGAAEDGDAATVLGGGSIVIHK